MNESVEAGVQGPAPSRVELDEELEFKVVAWLFIFACSLVAAFSLFLFQLFALLGLLRSLLLLGDQLDLRLSVLFIVVSRLSCYACLHEDLPQRHLVVEPQRTTLALRPTAVHAAASLLLTEWCPAWHVLRWLLDPWECVGPWLLLTR